MKKFIKNIIRSLYWKYAHDGDKWQMRLMMYHMGLFIRMDGSISNGEFILGQINEITGKLDLVAEARFPKIIGLQR